ncbi:hypothetical protein Q3G72_020800 [Acer saccharum]|nr:hypothetical protein Q3G72_020800 [Acer saccharum]
MPIDIPTARHLLDFCISAVCRLCASALQKGCRCRLGYKHQRQMSALLSLGLGLVCALSGCQPRDLRGYGSMTPQHPADTLWVNNGTEPETIDPGLCSESVGAELAQNLFAGLTDTDPKTLAPVGDIAERWDVDATQTHYTFYLRPSAWSDGRAVSAADFVYSWRRVLQPQTASRNASMLFVLRDAEAYNAGWLWAKERSDPELLQQALLARAPEATYVLHPRAHKDGTWIEIKSTTPPTQKAAMRAALLAKPLRLGTQMVQLSAATPDDVGIQALDAHTLCVHLERPAPYFLQLLAHTSMRPVPQHAIEALAQAALPETLWTRPEHIVSNGPYTLSRWRFRQDIELTKNPHYWGAGDVGLTHIKVLEVENAHTALNLYRTGQLDWLGANTSVPSAYLKTLRRYHDFHQDPILSVYFYWLNTQVKPLDDIRVRQALSLAIDRRALVQQVMQGGQIPTASLVPDRLSGYRARQTPLTDVARAKALLAQAGYPQGAHMPPITLVYNTGEDTKTKSPRRCGRCGQGI